MASSPFMALADVIHRRVMFALELVDKISGERVSGGLAVSVAGLARPTVTPSHRFVWTDLDPPADRSIDVRIQSLDGRFADATVHFEIDMHQPSTPSDKLLRTYKLEPTGLYRPAPGQFAVSGMVVETNDPRPPGVGLEVSVATPAGASAYTGLTDGRGGFVVAFPELVDLSRDAPGTESFGGWIAFRRKQSGQPDELRFSGALKFRPGRPLALPQTLVWATLAQNPPVP